MSVLALTMFSTALIAPPMVAHCHRIRARCDVCMIDELATVIEGAVGFLGAGIALGSMTKDKPTSVDAIANGPSKGTAVVSEAVVSEAVVSEAVVSEATVISWYDSGLRLIKKSSVSATSSTQDAKKPIFSTAQSTVESSFVAPLPPPGFVWAEDLEGVDQFPAPPSTGAAPSASPIEWPALGGSGAWHPMRGPWPKAPAREQWSPPPGWVPPTKPVLSWYDRGKRLSAPVDVEATLVTPAAPIEPPMDETPMDETALAEAIAASTAALMSPADALIYLCGAATRQSLLAKGVSLDVIVEATAVVRKAVLAEKVAAELVTAEDVPPALSALSEWPALGGSGAWHPMRGPWPKPPAREQWNPPPGWVPPTKPVLSWYDRGKRLRAPVVVQSWYDRGVRLTAAAAGPPTRAVKPIIQATKANVDAAAAATPLPNPEALSACDGAVESAANSQMGKGPRKRKPSRVLMACALTGAVLAIAARVVGVPVRLLS